MRILHIASHFWVYRGGAVQLIRMAIAQRKHGHEVSVICNMYPRQSEKRKKQFLETWSALNEAGIPVRQLRYENLRGLIQLRRIIKSESFDIVHAHRDPALKFSWLAVRRRKPPLLVAQRGTITKPPILPHIAFKSHRVRGIVAVSYAVKSVLIENGINVQKVHVVYGCVDPEEFSTRPKQRQLIEKLGIPLKSRIIGSLSAYRLAKGFQYLMPALAEIMHKHRDVHAVFLGYGITNKLKPLSDELGISRHCHFMGHQTNITDWLSIMDFTIVAAIDQEGLSGVLRESLAMEVPVISTDCAGNSEIVIDKKTGLLVPPRNAEALVEAMEWALTNPRAMKEMARRGREWIYRNCTIDVQYNGLLEVYKQVLNENTRNESVL